MTFRAIFLLAVALASAAEVDFSGSYSRSYPVAAGETVEVAVGLPAPSKLAPNGRVAVEVRPGPPACAFRFE